MEKTSDDYNYDAQRLFLEMMLSDPEVYNRIQSIYDPDIFHIDLKDAAEFIQKHSEKYQTLPELSQIKAMTGTNFKPLPTDMRKEQYEWFMDEFEAFTQVTSMEHAVLKAAKFLEKGDRGEAADAINKAHNISLIRDMGIDYFDSPKERLLAIKENNGQLSTGWVQLDKLLYGGFNRGELQIFVGGSGTGKSLFMQNLAVNWISAGLNGIFITLELSERLTAMRIDGMLTDISIKNIFKEVDDVDKKVKHKAKTAGQFWIKYLNAQSTINDVRAYVQELQIANGIKIDFMCIDYLDLLMPSHVKVSPNDLFVKDKFVSEDIRNFAKEINVVMVSASQLNRSSVNEDIFNHGMISGGISKIFTADNVFGIFTSMGMKEKGEYQLQAMKTRNSGGVGKKIDLAFDTNTLRITDPGVSASQMQLNTASSVVTTIKGNNVVEKNESDDQSAKLKDMLSNLRKQN